MANLNSTPSGERIHITFFGRRNVGKSSLVNAFTGQNLSVVSDTLGTTTDPVHKAMELLPLGAVEIFDTAGIDDEGELGALRVKKSLQVLNKTDIAVLVTDAPIGESEENLIKIFKSKNIPYIIAFNKADLLDTVPQNSENTVYVSAEKKEGIETLKETVANLLGKRQERPLVSDLIEPKDNIVLVTPIDAAAPKGRLILPQQQTIRDILDAGASAFVCKETELENTLSSLKNPPKLVITDSQAFGFVNKIVPEGVKLTSFSILMARYKGELSLVVEGASHIKDIKTGDKILVSEGCSHHRQCGDIGSVKIPNLIRKKLGVEPEFVFTSGADFPDDLSEFSLVVHCGGCMLTEKQMHYRLMCCQDAKIPVTNYGILIAELNGILKRSLQPFSEIYALLD